MTPETGKLLKDVDEILRGAGELGYMVDTSIAIDTLREIKEALARDRATPYQFMEERALRSIKVGEVLTQEQWDSVCSFMREQDGLIDRLQEAVRDSGAQGAITGWMDPETLDMIHVCRRESLIAHHVGAMRRMPYDYTVPLYTRPPVAGDADSAACCRSTPCKHPGVGPCDMPAQRTKPPSGDAQARVERVAKAIFEDQCPDDKWASPMDEDERESWRECARAALTAALQEKQ